MRARRDYAKEAYNDALQENLPSNIKDVLSQQAQAVPAAHNRVKMLRDAADAMGDNDSQEPSH